MKKVSLLIGAMVLVTALSFAGGRGGSNDRFGGGHSNWGGKKGGNKGGCIDIDFDKPDCNKDKDRDCGKKPPCKDKCTTSTPDGTPGD